MGRPDAISRSFASRRYARGVTVVPPESVSEQHTVLQESDCLASYDPPRNSIGVQINNAGESQVVEQSVHSRQHAWHSRCVDSSVSTGIVHRPARQWQHAGRRDVRLSGISERATNSSATMSTSGLAFRTAMSPSIASRRAAASGSPRLSFVNYKLRRDHVEFRPLLRHPSSGLELNCRRRRVGTRASCCVADDRRLDVDDIHSDTLPQRTPS